MLALFGVGAMSRAANRHRFSGSRAGDGHRIVIFESLAAVVTVLTEEVLVDKRRKGE